uniref:Uncharacterized protein n=1 Tax=Anguilla anguilla TaxID=7936 RepID=A0A0E9UYT9_ANGAN
MWYLKGVILIIRGGCHIIRVLLNIILSLRNILI